jgi:hypothetical protein
MLLQPDADGMTGRPQVAAVICRFRIFRSTSHWEHVLRQEPRDRLDLDCMHTGIDKAWVHRETACSNACSTAHSAASVAAGCLCLMQNIGLDGQESNCMELLALCTVLSMLLPTGLICDLCTGTGSQAQSTGREKCCRQAARQSTTKYLQCLQYQLCCTLCMELTK